MIAYKVCGNGSQDILYLPSWPSTVEETSNCPPHINFISKLGSFSRVIHIDKPRLSDAVSNVPSLTQHADSMRIVMEEIGSEHAVIFGASQSGFLAIMFAATFPERVAGLILHGCFGDFWAPDYPWRRSAKEWADWLNQVVNNTRSSYDQNASSSPVGDAMHSSKLLSDYIRHSTTPEMLDEFLQFMFDHGRIRDILPTIKTPTLVMHAIDDRWSNIENGRYLATRLPNATLIELPGSDHLEWLNNQDRIVLEIEEFVRCADAGPPTERVLLTVMITDIVESTATAARIGDESWRLLLRQHDKLIQRHVRQCGGTVVKSTGDGFFVTFDSPTRAIHCALAAGGEVRSLGVRIRVGIHTGECERRGDNLTGLGLHIAARIAEQAEPDTVWTSRSVKDLVVGSGIQFIEEGEKVLKGVPGEWPLFSVA